MGVGEPANSRHAMRQQECPQHRLSAEGEGGLLLDRQCSSARAVPSIPSASDNADADEAEAPGGREDDGATAAATARLLKALEDVAAAERGLLGDHRG